MKSMIITSIFCILCLCFTSLASEEDKRLKEMFGDQFVKELKAFDKRYQKMLESFFDEDFGSDFFNSPFSNFDNQAGFGMGQWKYTKENCELSISMKLAKDLKIEVKDRMISFNREVKTGQDSQDSGSFQRSKSVSSVNQSFSIPRICSNEQKEAKQSGEHLILIFPLIKTQKVKPKTRPISPKKGDTTI